MRAIGQDANKTPASENIFRSFILGAAIGVGLTVIEGLYDGVGVNNLKIFERGNKPSVARVYQEGRDNILIQDPNGDYSIHLKDYLKNINDKYPRDLERINIEKIVGLNDD